MAVLTWDEVGKRVYQTGIDHGVLYLQDGTVVAWNGLVDVEESLSTELKSIFSRWNKVFGEFGSG